jgi:succinyl-CoA:acetate CoA-transferase
MAERIAYAKAAEKLTDIQTVVKQVKDGDKIGVAGFTGAGYPKAFPTALSEEIKAAHERGEEFMVSIFTGASTAPDLDGVLAGVDGVKFRTPYNGDPTMRNKINDGTSLYSDIHLSHLAQQINQGWFGKIDWAVVEACQILDTGDIVPSTSVGNSRTYLENADKIVIEVNSWQSPDLYGLHDVYYGMEALPPNRVPIPITAPGDIIGQKTLKVNWDKVVGVVETNAPDRNSPFKALDEDSITIGKYFVDFLLSEVKAGRLPANLLPLQSGVGNVANAVLAGLLDSDLEHLTSYTEVIQDGLIALIDAGKMDVASATSFGLSPEYAARLNETAASYRGKVVLRPQDVSNHPEVVRRIGVIACNGMIEADIYGNVNSTNVCGTKMQNGIGGSGDFTRNAFMSFFVSPSLAKGGDISAIVPMVSHHDHTEHDVTAIVTEQGLADLRGLAPRQRSRVIIEKCAHPDYRPILLDYVERAEKTAKGLHTPHILTEALSFHQRFIETGSMKP